MSITHSDLLGTARRLSISNIVGEQPCESDLRSVASRAYYATLHAASDALPVDIQPSEAEIAGKSSHKAVIDAVILWSKTVRPGRSEAIVVARNLTKLKHLRKKADYFIARDFTAQEAASALAMATVTITSAEKARSLATAALIA